MAYPYRFTLSREASQDQQAPDGSSGHWMRVTCTAATVPAEETEKTAIFVFQREQSPVDPDGSGVKFHSFFSNVATPNDLEDITLEAEPADTDTTTPLFRLAAFEAYFPSRAELDDCWAYVQADVAALGKALSARATEDTPDTITLP